MKLKIEISLDNAAFEPHGEDTTSRFRNMDEPARILQNLAEVWHGSNSEPGESWNLHDINGNSVGQAKVTR